MLAGLFSTVALELELSHKLAVLKEFFVMSVKLAWICPF
jgi:hypothetical protein